MAPKVLVITGFGINGELEMAQSFRQNGAEADLVHLEDLINGSRKLDDYQMMAFPGGFAYADDLGAGIALANRIKNNLGDELWKFVERDTLILGICNGFQMMVNLGILPGFRGEMGERKLALRHNQTNRYQCRWVDLKVASKKCIWTKGLEGMHASVGHGEGNFYTDKSTLKRLQVNDQIVVQYVDAAGKPANGVYPINPNGAMEDIAGICDESGRIFGLMPHPDRLLTSYHDDLWTLHKEHVKRMGHEFVEMPSAQLIYKNAVEYFK